MLRFNYLFLFAPPLVPHLLNTTCIIKVCIESYKYDIYIYIYIYLYIYLFVCVSLWSTDLITSLLLTYRILLPSSDSSSCADAAGSFSLNSRHTDHCGSLTSAVI